MNAVLTSPLGFAGLQLMWLPQPSFGPIKAHEWWPPAARTQRRSHENFDYTVICVDGSESVQFCCLTGKCSTEGCFFFNPFTASQGGLHMILDKCDVSSRLPPPWVCFSMRGSIKAVCLQSRQAQAAVWYWNRSQTRWYQLTSVNRLTAWLLRPPSRWFDMLYSSSNLDCALDGHFPLSGHTWGSFLLCHHADWAARLSFCDVEHPEMLSPFLPWQRGRTRQFIWY